MRNKHLNLISRPQMTILSRQCNLGMMTSCCGETTVASEQRSIERFRKRDVDGIVNRKIVP